MGEKDTAMNQWLCDKVRFADLFNGSVFGGEQVVRPEELERIDSVSQTLLTDKKGNKKNVKRYRDVVMQWRGKMNLAILACETQDSIHYAMPVRAMIYDGLSYMEQIKIIKKENVEKKSLEPGNEFLTGLRKENRLHPVGTIVLYYGEEPWDGSRNLHELLEFPKDEKERQLLESLIPDYHINLIEADKIEKLKYYKTDLQLIFGLLQCKKDKQKFQNYIMEHEEYFQNLELETYEAVRVMLNSKTKMKKIKAANAKGRVDMCQEFGISMEETIARIMEKQSVSAEQAQEYVQKYWK